MKNTIIFVFVSKTLVTRIITIILFEFYGIAKTNLIWKLLMLTTNRKIKTKMMSIGLKLKQC